MGWCGEEVGLAWTDTQVETVWVGGVVVGVVEMVVVLWIGICYASVEIVIAVVVGDGSDHIVVVSGVDHTLVKNIYDNKQSRDGGI